MQTRNVCISTSSPVYTTHSSPLITASRSLGWLVPCRSKCPMIRLFLFSFIKGEAGIYSHVDETIRLGL